MTPTIDSLIATIDQSLAQIARLQSLCDLWSRELNRRVEVEQVLWNVGAGKRPPLTPDECRALAVKLGVNPELMAVEKIFPQTGGTAWEPVQLVWSEPTPPNGETYFYDHIVATTPLGEYSVQWKSWKQFDSPALYFDGNFVDVGNNIYECKIIAQKHFNMKIYSCLVLQTPKETPNVPLA